MLNDQSHSEADIVKSSKENAAENSSMPPISYHYAAFRAGADGRTAWFDGVIQLHGVILSNEHYQALKKTLCQHYDIREDNFVITSLSRLDMMHSIALPSKPPTNNTMIQEGK